MRRYSWPQGHWAWPVKLTHKHVVRHGNMIFTGGQVDLDHAGKVRHPGELVTQTTESMKYMAALFDDLDADFSDLVRLVVYFTGNAADEAKLVQTLGSILGGTSRPAINLICMPELCYPGMRVEIEGVAMRSEDGSRLARREMHLPELPLLPDAFSHVVECQGMVFTSDMSAITDTGDVGSIGDIAGQTRSMMENLGKALSAAGCDFGDVVKLNVYYCGDGTAASWTEPAKIRAGYFPDPGPAATGMPLERFADRDVLTRIAVTAVRQPDDERQDKQFSWPAGHWNWTQPMPYKHGNRAGNIIHVGGKV